MATKTVATGRMAPHGGKAPVLAVDVNGGTGFATSRNVERTVVVRPVCGRSYPSMRAVLCVLVSD